MKTKPKKANKFPAQATLGERYGATAMWGGSRCAVFQRYTKGGRATFFKINFYKNQVFLFKKNKKLALSLKNKKLALLFKYIFKYKVIKICLPHVPRKWICSFCPLKVYVPSCTANLALLLLLVLLINIPLSLSLDYHSILNNLFFFLHSTHDPNRIGRWICADGKWPVINFLVRCLTRKWIRPCVVFQAAAWLAGI